ncbi:hypothetical protein ACO0LL_10985 [Undibacterium sp. TC4M20W]|uniref:hypothetical protein n=1 Tax=Undibacterium sp. TC4M20W TaxID=3413052 RepID=UPI003BF3ED23
MKKTIKQNTGLNLPLKSPGAEQFKKRAIPISLLLGIFSAAICYIFLLLQLTAMSGTNNISRQLVVIANSPQVSATLNLSPNCSVWTLQALRLECGEVQVAEEYVNKGQLPQLIAALTNPCVSMQGLPEADRDKARRYFQCDGNPIPYKATVSIVKITTTHPEPRTSINKKEKVGEIVINKF